MLPRSRSKSRRDAGCFWRQWRLVAVDGTQFSLYNTPQNNAALPKSKTRRGRAAFAKIVTSVMVEVGLHNPLAAAIGHDGRSEWKLSRSLLAQLPKQALLLADRLHGCAAFAVQEIAACVLASALIAREREIAAAGEVPVLSISFANPRAVASALDSLRAGRGYIVRAAKTGIDEALLHSCARLRHYAQTQAQAILSTSGSTTRQ